MFIKIKTIRNSMIVINTETIRHFSFIPEKALGNDIGKDFYYVKTKDDCWEITPKQYKKLMKVIEEYYEIEDISHVDEKVKTYTEKPKKLRDGKFALNDIKENSNYKN